MLASLNWVDYIIILIFLLSVLTGLSRGLVREMISLLTLITAFALAIMFANSLAAFISSSDAVQNIISQSNAKGVDATQPISYVLLGISFAIIFAGIILIGAVFGLIINLAFKSGVLGIGNRIMGAIFGLVRGYIMTLVVIFVVQLTPLSTQYWWQQSVIVNAYQPAVLWLDQIVSPTLANIKQSIGESIQNAAGQLHSMARSYHFSLR